MLRGGEENKKSPARTQPRTKAVTEERQCNPVRGRRRRGRGWSRDMEQAAAPGLSSHSHGHTLRGARGLYGSITPAEIFSHFPASSPCCGGSVRTERPRLQADRKREKKKKKRAAKQRIMAAHRREAAGGLSRGCARQTWGVTGEPGLPSSLTVATGDPFYRDTAPTAQQAWGIPEGIFCGGVPPSVRCLVPDHVCLVSGEDRERPRAPCMSAVCLWRV